MWMLAVLGCGAGPENIQELPDESTGKVTVTEPDLPTSPTDLRGFAEAAGYDVADGLFQISDYAGCCGPEADCLGNNPATPYGTWAVPPGPGEVRDHSDPFEPWGFTPEPLGRTFRLRQDEAVVWTGTAPPKAAYFSVRSYLGTRTDPLGESLVIGSLGPSANHISIGEQRGEPVWDQPLAVVTTANAAVEAEVIGMLEALGFDENQVIRDRLPADLLTMGLEPGADTFQIVSRAAIYDDPVAGEAWLADPGASVWRLSPSVEREANHHPAPVLPPRGTGDDESQFVPSMDALEELFGELYGDAIIEQTTPGMLESIDCIDLGFCAGDIRDRMAAISTRFFLPRHTEFVVWGVNHTRSGKSSYSNISLVSEKHTIGLDGMTNLDMPGTAQAFGYEGEDADDLFAFLISRDCAAFDVPCIEVSYGCPDGVGHLERMWVTSRAYLEPETGAAPAGEELVTFRIAKVLGPSPDTGSY